MLQYLTNAPEGPHTWKLTTGNDLDTRKKNILNHAQYMLFHKFASVVFK